MVDYRPARRSSRSRLRRSRLQSRRRINFNNIFIWSKLTKYAFFAVIAMVLAVPLMFLWFSRDLPTPGKIVE